MTAVDLGGDGAPITSKTYDVVDQDGALISVTFDSNGDYIVNGTGETGTFEANTLASGVVTLVDDQDPTNVTLMIVMDGDATVVDDTATILLAATTEISATDFVFNEIGLGSVTLKSTSTTP